LHIGKIPDPEKLATALNAVCGVVEHGLFIGLAARAYIGTGNGVQTI
jgi:ribose 5-phosphate isomerase A